MALSIEKLASGALGVSHINGKTVFIENALPGEIVEVEIKEEKKGYIMASSSEIIKRAENRIDPICPYYGICGGCDFQFVNEKDSAYLKEAIVKDNLKRIAHMEKLPVFDEPAYGKMEGYRSRCRVHVDLKTKKQGFLKKDTNELLDIDFCPALEGKLNDLIAEKGGRLFKEARSKMFENRVNRNTGYAEVALFSGDKEVSFGKNLVDILISGVDYKVNANVFFQSNPRVLPELFDFVRKHTVGDTIMDLYSGVGTFSALFEGTGKTVYAVERQKECLALARINAPSAISFSDDVAVWGRKSGRHVDTVIVDPPRVGLDKGVPEMISSWKPERIIYVSCNSVTAARDLPLFVGYEIERVKVLDFYPGSSHVETVVLLTHKYSLKSLTIPLN